MRALFFLLLVSFSFAVGPEIPNSPINSSNFILYMSLNSGGGSANSSNYFLDADIGSPAVGNSSSSNFALSLTSIQSAAPAEAPAPPEPEPEPVAPLPSASDATNSLGIASPDLNVSSLNSSSSYTVSLRVGSQWAASKTLRFSSGVTSIVVNALISPVSTGKMVTIQVN